MNHKYAPEKQAFGFKIFYSDGRIYSGATTEHWNQLPQDGVQVIVIYFRDNTKLMMSGQDLYCLEESEKIQLPKEVKRGQMIDRKLHDEIYNKAKVSKW